MGNPVSYELRRLIAERKLIRIRPDSVALPVTFWELFYARCLTCTWGTPSP